jgi:hypothetical protein
VVVPAIRLRATSKLVSGRARQFIEMKEKRRCSTLFHFDVPGGRWHTLISRPVSVARTARLAFHALARELLEPPPSAVISRRVALG